MRIAIQTSYAIASTRRQDKAAGVRNPAVLKYAMPGPERSPRYHVDVLSPRPGFVTNVRRVLDYAGVAQGRVGPPKRETNVRQNP